MTSMLFIGGHKNGQEFNVAPTNQIRFAIPRSLSVEEPTDDPAQVNLPVETYDIERADDGSFYAVWEGFKQ